jgi:hypothetical protein
MIPVYIVDVMAAVVGNVETEVLSQIQAAEVAALGTTLIQTINFQYGHKRELIETMMQWDRDPELKFQKYPLVYLVQDFKESRGKDAGIYAELSANIIIAHQTDQTYKITDRYANVFKPVLYPIYYSLLNQLSIYPQVNEGVQELLVHDKWDRSYWGRAAAGGSTDRTTLNDFVDAIEIDNLVLKINILNC